MKYVFWVIVAMGMSFAQIPDTQWTKTFGGDNWDEGRSVKQTLDGGYIIVGYTSSFGAGGADVYLIKTDSSGDLLWQKTFGGASHDRGYSVCQTSDGGYIITGYTSSFGAGETDVYLIKTDSSGDLLWQKTFGGADWDEGYSVQQTSDGGYIITGYTRSFGAGSYDVYLIKTDSSGNLLWQKTFGGADIDASFSVQQSLDGGYIVVGGTSSFGTGGRDVYLIKTDSSGDLLWQKTFGGTDWDQGFSVQQTLDEGYIIVGNTNSFGAGEKDVYLIKTDSSGDLLWQKTFGGTSYDEGYSVHQVSDGGYIISGETWSFDATYNDVYLIKTDLNGNLLWQRTYSKDFNEVGYSVQETLDGGYIIVGYTGFYLEGRSNVYLIKLTPGSDIMEFDLDRGGKSSVFSVSLFFDREIILRFRGFWGRSLKVVLYNLYGKEVFRMVYPVISYSSLRLESREIKKLPVGIYFLSVFSGKRKLGEAKLIKP